MKRSSIYYIYTHNNRHDRFRNGLKANTELSFFGAKALSEVFPNVHFLKLQGEKERRLASIRPQDVVIGHFGETFLRASARTNRLITFAPWAGHDDRSKKEDINCISFEVERRFYDKASAIILLTSEYNQRTYLDHPQNFWYPYFDCLKQNGVRIRVVHQPIDFSLFPRIKWTYETQNFLYIGNRNYMKCVPDTERLVKAIGRELHLFGTGGRSLNHLDRAAVDQLPGLADFFIQPGMWEAQCVSILEAAARGFIPLVSPETGYPYDHPYLLRYGDFEYNLKQLRAVLALPAEEKRQLAGHLHRQLIEDPKHNAWSALTGVLIEEVKRLLD